MSSEKFRAGAMLTLLLDLEATLALEEATDVVGWSASDFTAAAAAALDVVARSVDVAAAARSAADVASTSAVDVSRGGFLDESTERRHPTSL